MSDTKTLLAHVKDFLAEEKVREEERKNHGELFNLLLTTKIATDEVKMSALFTELLNPNGSHGMGKAFFEEFIATVKNKDARIIDFDTDAVEVDAEYNIGVKDVACENGGQIDILLHNDKNQFIVIENKINANDQESQLCRYANYCKNNRNSKEYSIIYLTKEGVEASQKSLASNKDLEYIRISYRHEIIAWLNRCAKIATFRPRVREVLGQCIEAIKAEVLKINDTDEKLAELLASEENIETTLEILEGAEAGDETAQTICDRKGFVFALMWKRFVGQVKKIAGEYHLTFETNGIAFTDDKSWLTLLQPDISKEWMIFIGTDDPKEGLHAGIGRYGADIPDFTAEQVERLKAITPETDGWLKPANPNDEKDVPIGHKTYCADVSVFKADVGVMRMILLGELAHKIETEVVQFALEEHLIKKLVEILRTK